MRASYISFAMNFIDHKDMLLREQLEHLKSAEETNADYENTIAQFTRPTALVFLLVDY